MAKALIGYLNSDPRTASLAAEAPRLRARVAELEALVLRLQEENDRLTSIQAHALLEQPDVAPERREMQPA